MTDLIERLSALDGPDREVDALLWWHHVGKAGGWEYDGQQRKPYTESIDAALTLFGGDRKRLIINIAEDDITSVIYGGAESVASTPAIALCIAACKALEARENSHG